VRILATAAGLLAVGEADLELAGLKVQVRGARQTLRTVACGRIASTI
jgi:hypothetical protein